ncbi:glycerophosphodiester phosphodiesterase family protein [Lutibacter sp.]
MKKCKKLGLLLIFTIMFASCNYESKKEIQKKEVNTIGEISTQAKKVRDYVNKDIVIAHRGSTYWAPEETEPAFLWARNIGADYLELDVQLTKDSILVAFHDDNLKRTTNVSEVFPKRMNAEIRAFTLKELRSLDAGSKFNQKNPDRAKNSYKGLNILTFKDVLMIAEGYRIKKRNGVPVKEMVKNVWTGNYLYEKDPNDNGNKPGIYCETKNPKLGMEKILSKELTKYGWNINTNPKEIKTHPNKVGVANTNARFILQSFSRKSIVKLEKYLPNIPKCLLLWKPDMKGDLKKNYMRAIKFGIENNVQCIGPSIAGKPNNYEELSAPWMVKLIHNAGMLSHLYTFDTNEQFDEYKGRADGVFTNRADLALKFYGRKSKYTPQEILVQLGYK